MIRSRFRNVALLCPCLVAFGLGGARVRAEPAVAASPHGVLVPVVPRLAHDTIAYRLIASQEAKKADMPFALVDAVMAIESGYRADRIGDVGEIGLMQVRPATAAMLGFRGAPAALADPAVNIHYGATYLGRAWHLAHGDVCRALMKYRAGHGETAMSPLSVTYCTRAKAHLASMGSPLADTIKPSDLVATLMPAFKTSVTAPGVAVSAQVGQATGRAPRSGPAFWTAFRAKIAAANAKIEAKWRRVATR